jgi:hypothetical protein
VPLEARLRRARFRYEAAKIERARAIVSAHRAGLSVRKIAAAVGLGATRVHQLLSSPVADVFETRLDVLRLHGWPAPEDPRSTPRPGTQSPTASTTRPKRCET